jgi:MFS family permease
LTFVVGIGSIWMVYDWPAQASFLSPLERACILHRLQADNGLMNEGKFSWAVIRKAALEWKTWTLMLLYIGVACPLYGLSIFLPTIIRALGKWSTPQSLLLSTPPFAFALVTTMTTAFLSDRWGKRGFFLMFWSTWAIVGYIILMTVSVTKPVSRTSSRSSSRAIRCLQNLRYDQGVRYLSCFILLGGIAPCIATTIVWAGNTFGNHYRKSMAMGLIFSTGELR